MPIISPERLGNRNINMRTVLNRLKHIMQVCIGLTWPRINYNAIPFEHNNDILGAIKPQHFKKDPEWRS
jgi:hypothetical protein